MAFRIVSKVLEGKPLEFKVCEGCQSIWAPDDIGITREEMQGIAESVHWPIGWCAVNEVPRKEYEVVAESIFDHCPLCEGHVFEFVTEVIRPVITGQIKEARGIPNGR